jgi:hypothetical protein
VNTLLYTLLGAEFIAAAVRTALAAGHIKLFKSTLTPDPSTPLADFISAEANFTGYAAIAVTNWNTPILGPGSSFQIGMPLVQFETANPTTVGNEIGGWFYEDAANAVGVIFGTFATPVQMEVPFQGIPLAPVLVFPTGA